MKINIAISIVLNQKFVNHIWFSNFLFLNINRILIFSFGSQNVIWYFIYICLFSYYEVYYINMALNKGLEKSQNTIKPYTVCKFE